MPVDDLDVIDAIGLDSTTEEVVLTIADHLDWDEGDEHLKFLQNKINRYLDFIQTGELLERYPMAHARQIRIDVICRWHPSSHALEFLERARQVIETNGWHFSWRVVNTP